MNLLVAKEVIEPCTAFEFRRSVYNTIKLSGKLQQAK